MKPCLFDVHKITTDPKTGRKEFVFPDGRKAITGTDVSEFVGEVDWPLVKDDGIDFVFVRIGKRDLTTGILAEDKRWRENVAGAAKAGLKVGAYFVTSALNEEEVREEAEYVKDLLKGQPITWPLAFDVEVPKKKWRTYNMDPHLLTDLTLIFTKELESYNPILYCNSIPELQKKFELERLDHIQKWITEYRFKPYYPYDFSIWQYSYTARIKGIDSPGDYDLSFIDFG
jgi:GH25 family lysozyme M1 (1,4-beta-N-acetylmuramidase)